MQMTKNIYTLYNIDASLLKRDYIKFPLVKKDGFHLSEMPFKEDFYFLYIICNVRRADLSKYFNVGKTTIDNFGYKFGIKKSKKVSHQNSVSTCLKRYGKSNVFQVASIKKRQEKTVYARYGVKNISEVNSIKIKKIETTRRNKTYSSSKPEEEINNLLLRKFKDISRQHNTSLYPFPCDFYIPQIDLYIEYQGSWCHGGEPFDKNNSKHIEKLNLWKSRAQQGHPRYYDSIKTWTIKDPLKRKTAKDNNLNWLEFFTLEDFMKWYNSL